VAAVTALLFAASPDSATSREPGPFHPLARARSPVVSDADRNAAFIDRRGKTRVLDARGRPIHRIPTPSAGRAYNTSLVAMRSGYVLWAAYHRAPPFTAINEVARVWIGSVATGAVQMLDTGPWSRLYDDAFPRSIGMQWVEADTNGRLGDSRGAHLTYLNWHTGAVATDTRDQPGNVASVTPDLDRPELWSPLCPPLRRPPDNMAENEGLEPFLRYQYAPPFGLPERQTNFSLQLYRCGKTTPRSLSRCRSGCWAAQLGPSAVVWKEGRYARVHRLALACSRRLRLPGNALLGQHQVAHTRSRVFLSAERERSRLQRIYSARLPACRQHVARAR
jgi:hypothetical protein